MDGHLESTTSFSIILSGTIRINEKSFMELCKVFNEAAYSLNMNINWVGCFWNSGPIFKKIKNNQFVFEENFLKAKEIIEQITNHKYHTINFDDDEFQEILKKYKNYSDLDMGNPNSVDYRVRNIYQMYCLGKSIQKNKEVIKNSMFFVRARTDLKIKYYPLQIINENIEKIMSEKPFLWGNRSDKNEISDLLWSCNKSALGKIEEKCFDFPVCESAESEWLKIFKHNNFDIQYTKNYRINILGR
jgi:hypothetical protein